MQKGSNFFYVRNHLEPFGIHLSNIYLGVEVIVIAIV